MHINKKQQDRVLEHLNKALKKPPRCPVCEDANWGITDEVFEMRGFHEGEKRTSGDPITPTVILTCKNCGNILLFNASLVGIFEPPKKGK